jgi:hypothetical protein
MNASNTRAISFGRFPLVGSWIAKTWERFDDCAVKHNNIRACNPLLRSLQYQAQLPGMRMARHKSIMCSPDKRWRLLQIMSALHLSQEEIIAAQYSLGLDAEAIHRRLAE